MISHVFVQYNGHILNRTKVVHKVNLCMKADHNLVALFLSYNKNRGATRKLGKYF